jgi:hypothetical protein
LSSAVDRAACRLLDDPLVRPSFEGPLLELLVTRTDRHRLLPARYESHTPVAQEKCRCCSSDDAASDEALPSWWRPAVPTDETPDPTASTAGDAKELS